MSLQQVARQAAVSQKRPDEADTRLHWRWLIFARAAWFALVIPAFGLYITASIRYINQLNPDTAIRAQMLHPGPPINGYILSYSHLYSQFGGALTPIVILASLASPVWIAIGLVIVWRKSDDRMGLLAAFGFILFGFAISPQLYIMNILSDALSLWRWPIALVDALGWGFLGLVLILFPNGRFVPRWTRWLVPVYALFLLCWILPSNVVFSTVQWPLLLILARDCLFLAPIYIQIHRYRHPSNMIERQQTKWIVFAIIITMLADVGFATPVFSFSRPVYEIVSTILYPFVLYLYPLVFGIAILRYRLWDIDIIINRTLVYGTLTVSLATVYAGLVIGLQSLVQAITGEALKSPIILVVSTLVIASLFHPLRRNLQKTIDRRFYRRKYDAARTLQAFSATLRSEVDLNQLREQLLVVVEETIQPTFVSLWLRPLEHDSRPENPDLPIRAPM